MNLETTYLGLRLRTPVVVSASPLSEKLDNLLRMEAAGASAIVLHSLFEEQIRRDHHESFRVTEQGTESYPEALTYFPDPGELSIGPEAYLTHIERAKRALRVPIIASLNGSTPGGWTRFARKIEDAGADALELNLYSVPTDPDLSGAEIEQRDLDVVRAVKREVKFPVAVKISPYFTNFSHVAKRFDASGSDGLVLFNRFYQPDIDLETLDIVPHVSYSTSVAMRLPLQWMAILYGHLRASLAASGGVHSGTDVIKLLMAGADVTMVCSVLIQQGIEHLRIIERQLVDWMKERHYESVGQLKGCLSLQNCPDPAAFERAQYMRAVGVHKH